MRRGGWAYDDEAAYKKHMSAAVAAAVAAADKRRGRTGAKAENGWVGIVND